MAPNYSVEYLCDFCGLVHTEVTSSYLEQLDMYMYKDKIFQIFGSHVARVTVRTTLLAVLTIVTHASYSYCIHCTLF